MVGKEHDISTLATEKNWMKKREVVEQLGQKLTEIILTRECKCATKNMNKDTWPPVLCKRQTSSEYFHMGIHTNNYPIFHQKQICNAWKDEKTIARRTDKKYTSTTIFRFYKEVFLLW